MWEGYNGIERCRPRRRLKARVSLTNWEPCCHARGDEVCTVEFDMTGGSALVLVEAEW